MHLRDGMASAPAMSCLVDHKYSRVAATASSGANPSCGSEFIGSTITKRGLSKLERGSGAPPQRAKSP